MIQSSSLATLIVVSRLSCPSRAGLVAKTSSSGISRATADKMLCIASFALTVAFSVTAHGPGLLNLVEKENADADTSDVREDSEEYSVVDNENVKVSWMQRSCLAELRQENQPRISTRRERRAYDTSSRNYSDFCNTDISRQIEGMVLEIESAYENRNVRKSKHIINQQLCADSKPLVTKRVQQAHCTNLTFKRIRNESFSPLVKNVFQNNISTLNENTRTISQSPPQMPLHEHQKTSKSIKDTPRFKQLRQALQTIQKSDDCMPAMRPCDSLASLSSDYSVCTRSSLDSLDASSTKKPWMPSLQRNAEWAIMD